MKLKEVTIVADKTLPLDATGQLQLKLIDNGDGTYSISAASGSIVEIGGVTFAVSGGDTLRGKSADKPDAAAAHAVIPFCYYFSVDTGIVEVTDGTNWVVI